MPLWSEDGSWLGDVDFTDDELRDLVAVIRAGLATKPDISDVMGESLWQWCNDEEGYLKKMAKDREKRKKWRPQG